MVINYDEAGISWPKCDVCGKSVKGFTFRCRACSFQMHPCCAMLSTEMTFPPTPPADHQHSLKLLPTGSQLIGSNSITTATSTSNNNNNNSNSTAMMVEGGGQQQLQQAALCGECKRKRSGGRIYRCTVCNYHLHAVCAKAMINGLRANGMAAPEKPTKSMLGTAARLASQVVIEFIGGLIEGFGEGVGQALVQNITRSRSRRRRRLLRTTTSPT